MKIESQILTASQLIDLTSCRRIMNYLKNDPAITDVIEVLDAGLPLAEVGDIFMSENPDMQKVKTWFEQKKLIKYNRAHHCRTPFHFCVDCIRLEPFYIIKSRGKVYE